MSKKLAGRVAVVTGASKGIGAAIAKALAEEGASVVVNYSSSKQDAERVVEEISTRGGRAIAAQGDVSNSAHIERLFSETKGSFGRLDILVNNAGVYEFAPLEAVTEQHFHKHFDLNVLGLLLATKEAVKHMGSEGGSIINIGSLASSMRMPNSAVYSASKGLRRNRLSENGRGVGATRTHGAARRYRADVGVSGVVGFEVYDRGDAAGVGRPEVENRARAGDSLFEGVARYEQPQDERPVPERPEQCLRAPYA